jgi:hypothetical protein
MADLMNELEAIADAAYGLYASTKKVNVAENANTLSKNLFSFIPPLQ